MVTTPNYDLDVDTTLGGNNASDYTIPSQKAIKAYVDNNTGSTVDQTYDGTSTSAQSGVAIAGELTKYAQKAVDTDITGVYNFKGQKKIKFTQSSSSDKLGFTLYNNSNVEKGYLEYNPTNTVDSVPLMTLGNYATASAGLTHVGFRKYSNVSGASGAYNLLAPLVSDAKTPFNLTTTYTNFYLPLGFTDGNTTVKAAKSGMVDISSLLPDVSNFVTNSSLATTLSSYATQSWVGQQGYITGITSSDVTTALGYTPYNSTNPNGYQANVIETIKVNNTAQTITSKAVNITVPTNTNQLTNGAGFITGITSSDVTGALGYTPYNSSNPNGYISSIPSSYLQNTALGEDSLTLLGFGYASDCAINIGPFSYSVDFGAVALGFSAVAEGEESTALGYTSYASADYSIQIGFGTNTTASTLSIGFNNNNNPVNYQLLDGTTGLIPDARLSTNIARVTDIPDVSNFVTNSSLTTTLSDYALLTDIPTVPTNISAFTNDSGYLSTVTYNSATETLTLS